MKKYQLKVGLERHKAFGELLGKTKSFSAFTYDPTTGIAITEPEKEPPTMFTRISRFTSRSEIKYEDISNAPPIDTPARG